VLVAVSKGMWAVKLCTNNILQLSGGWRCRLTQVDLYNGRKTGVVVVVVVIKVKIM